MCFTTQNREKSIELTCPGQHRAVKIKTLLNRLKTTWQKNNKKKKNTGTKMDAISVTDLLACSWIFPTVKNNNLQLNVLILKVKVLNIRLFRSIYKTFETFY